MSSFSPKICISLLPESFSQLLEWISKSEDGDLIEIRLDYLMDIDFYTIRQLTQKKIIATIRTPEEGGCFKGSISEAIKIYQKALDCGINYIDVQYSLSNDILKNIKLKSKKQLILSYHTEKQDITWLKQNLSKMLKIEAGTYKLVNFAFEINKCFSILQFLDNFPKEDNNFIIHSMGEAGKLSRLIGSIKGNAWTYVSLNENQKTAEGQLSVNEAVNHYFLKEKSLKTKIFGLVGYPLIQSRGWLLHNKLIHLHSNKYNISKFDALYLNFEIKDFEQFWITWQSLIRGLSVTIPFKETVLRFVGEHSDEVKLSGVCNTLIEERGYWKAYNTDFIAILNLLSPFKKELEKGVLVIGTGATSRTVAAVLKQLSIERVFITGRNSERAHFLSNLFSITFINNNDLNTLEIKGIIQTTPVGMFPETQNIPVGTELFKKGMLVFDVIHNPPMTRFLKIAREKRCKTISGEKMFLDQAVKQFEIFFNHPTSNEYIMKTWRDIIFSND